MGKLATTNAAEVDCLLAVSALSAATARLAAVMQGSTAAWRTRAVSLTHTAAKLGGEMEVLRSVRSEQLRHQHALRVGSCADAAATLAMRLHNLLPRGRASEAAFDVAASATTLSLFVRALSKGP